MTTTTANCKYQQLPALATTVGGCVQRACVASWVGMDWATIVLWVGVALVLWFVWQTYLEQQASGQPSSHPPNGGPTPSRHRPL